MTLKAFRIAVDKARFLGRKIRDHSRLHKAMWALMSEPGARYPIPTRVQGYKRSAFANDVVTVWKQLGIRATITATGFVVPTAASMKDLALARRQYSEVYKDPTAPVRKKSRSQNNRGKTRKTDTSLDGGSRPGTSKPKPMTAKQKAAAKKRIVTGLAKTAAARKKAMKKAPTAKKATAKTKAASKPKVTKKRTISAKQKAALAKGRAKMAAKRKTNTKRAPVAKRSTTTKRRKKSASSTPTLF